MMNLKPIHSIMVFAALATSSMWAAYSSYEHTLEAIVSDMNQALAQTLDDKSDRWITPDTIQTYRSHLKLDALKACSFVTYAMDNDRQFLCSRRMRWQKDDNPLVLQGYANCSAASVFSMSDQRISAFLSLLALLWAGGMMMYFRKHNARIMTVGGLMMCDDSHCFYAIDHSQVTLTPLQEQLMRMFFTSEDNYLSKQEICDALWPKKPYADETLYTLIRRLKPIVEESGNLEIICERGKGYKLRSRS